MFIKVNDIICVRLVKCKALTASACSRTFVTRRMRCITWTGSGSVDGRSRFSSLKETGRV